MKETVHKYHLEIEDEQEVLLPAGARILTVQPQNDVINLWAMVNPAATAEAVNIRMYGTGHPIDNGEEEYLNTVQLYGGRLILHIFIMARNEKNNVVGMQGWECPKCGRVYSPYASMCKYCECDKIKTNLD